MTVLLVRPDTAIDDDAKTLRARGFEVVTDPYITVVPSADAEAGVRMDRLLRALADGAEWLMVTSAAAPRAMVSIAGCDRVRAAVGDAARQGTQFAAVGPASARALLDLGAGSVRMPGTGHTASALLSLLADGRSGRAVLPRSSIGDPLLPTTLTARGWTLIDEVVYETSAVRSAPTSALGLQAGDFAAVVLRSPSAARAVARWAGTVHPRTAVVAGGPTTALAAARAGLHVSVVATGSRPDQIADAVEKVTHDHAA